MTNSSLQASSENETFPLHGEVHPKIPLLLTAPHSGERIPPEASWLEPIPQLTLLTDVDRFVDQLYSGAADRLHLPLLTTTIHRYAADLNRYPEDVDQDSVQRAAAASGAFATGFHWVRTTQGETVLTQAIPQTLHQEITRRYHDAFHQRVAELIAQIRARSNSPVVYHLDCHSMPSQGTKAHRDQGQARAEVVISDSEGKSASKFFRDTVISAFQKESFQTALNWPYVGGRITQRYGKPNEGHHTIQIELNRKLYMDEKTKEKLPSFDETCLRLEKVIARIQYSLLNVPETTN